MAYAFTRHYMLLLVTLFVTSSLIAYEHDLAVCAIFQNEARFLKEWIEFYKLIGVQKFYLYDHKSTDNYKEVLDPYIKSGEVKGQVQWLAILDIDEFLFPVQHDSLLIALKDYESYAGVCVRWVMFGTSGVDIIPADKLMIESLTMRHPKIDKQIKSIVQPDKIIALYTHTPEHVVPGFDMVYEDKTLLLSTDNIPSINIFRINHYWSRDKKFLHEVKIPRIEKNYFWIKEEKKAWVLQMTEWMNDQQDLAIQRFVGQLKKAMGFK
ncbi:MAG: glycosyltransferase family 92 protein [Candidatus Dependentiae bacterium]|nr:glycosyltransferase family 92 protein [Candidatus Dependentiae bacterium]